MQSWSDFPQAPSCRTCSQRVTKALPTGQGQINHCCDAANAASGAGLAHCIETPDGGALSYAYDGDPLSSEGRDGGNNVPPPQLLVDSAEFDDL